MNGVFVTGTDTGVGKTRVACALAHALAARGARVRARKPVESGVDARNGPADAQALREAAGAHEPVDAVCALTLRAALSPERAAALEGRALALDDVIDAARRGVGAEDFALVEGAGGLYSPIADGALNADLADALGLPVLVVAADRLGTINHCLLTLEALQRRGRDVVALVLSRTQADVTEGMDNAADLRRRVGVPVIELAYGEDTGAAAWAREAVLLDGLAAGLLGSAR